MKHRLLILVLGLTTPLLAEPTTANEFFKAGENALKQGDVKTAESSYRKALQLNPNHGNARYRLVSMKNLKPEARIRVRKNQFEAIKLPNVIFEDLSLEESLEALGAMVEQASENTFVPNFVLDDPNRTITENSVNIRLRNIPASVALKYVLSQAKAKATWDAHVINVRPLSSKGSAKTPAIDRKDSKSKGFEFK